MNHHPLAAMMAYPQWVCWRAKPKPDSRIDKVPTDPRTGRACNPLDPASWMDYPAAQSAAANAGLGVGFVFTENDPFTFIDLDKCANPLGPRPWQDHAYGVIERFPGAAIEVSCSGRGLHILFRCSGNLRHSNKCPRIRGELYTSQRFVAIGSNAIGSADIDHSVALQAFIAEYFPPNNSIPGAWTDTPRADYTGPTDDDDLIRRATMSRSASAAFGSSATFEDLWDADADKLATAYPGTSDLGYDASSADAGLARHLAFWTGCDCDRILRLMQRSSLCRDKWTREDYIRGTILFAVNGTQNVYDKVEVVAEDAPATDGYCNPIETVESYPYCGPAQLLDVFQEYVYVESVDRVVGPSGTLLDSSRFRKRLRARVYALDHAGQKTTTDAWKAFHESQCYDFRQADCLTFAPGKADRVFRDGVRTYANTWRDQRPPRISGDASPFLNHIKKLLPDGDDASILLAYLAACVQHQGVKFGWSPLVQGVQGNGKSTVAKILRHALGGYVHTMSGSRLTQQFNGWLSENVICVVEDLQIKGDRSGALEIIKPMITEEYQQIERKGIDIVAERVCCNFIMLSNHRDAIPIDRNERRFAVFFCAQQSLDDLVACGLSETYFVRFYAWLESSDGYAIVADYLHSYDIPAQFNPAQDCRRAPSTSSLAAAIHVTLSAEAQTIMEAVDSGEAGFRGGWISSRCATSQLADSRLYVSPQRLSQILERIGYVPHPALSTTRNSRASRVIPQEGGRPRLYVRQHHLAASLTQNVTDAYARAQGYTVDPAPASAL